MRYRNFILLLLLVLLATSCDENDTECRRDVRKKLGVTFYTVNTITTDQGITETIEGVFSPDSLCVRGLGKDSLLYNSKRSDVTLPVSNTDTITAYEIYVRADNDELNRHLDATDTLLITYDNEQHFVSLECGCYVNHTLHSAAATTHNIDSIVIINQQITNADDIHLQIYFR